MAHSANKIKRIRLPENPTPYDICDAEAVHSDDTLTETQINTAWTNSAPVTT